MFKHVKGKITSKDHEQIAEFSLEFKVESEAVIVYVRHLEQIKMTAGINSRERKTRNSKYRTDLRGF